MGKTAMKGAVPEEIVREAKKDPLLGPRIVLSSTRRVPLMHGRECIGFVTPHETRSGWRAGPIYVVPGHRGHGHVEAFYASHADRTWVAFVPDGYAASLTMHKRAGFIPWKSGRGGQWLRREAAR